MLRTSCFVFPSQHFGGRVKMIFWQPPRSYDWVFTKDSMSYCCLSQQNRKWRLGRQEVLYWNVCLRRFLNLKVWNKHKMNTNRIFIRFLCLATYLLILRFTAIQRFHVSILWHNFKSSIEKKNARNWISGKHSIG